MPYFKFANITKPQLVERINKLLVYIEEQQDSVQCELRNYQDTDYYNSLCHRRDDLKTCMEIIKGIN